MAKDAAILARWRDTPGNRLPILHGVQQAFGCVPSGAGGVARSAGRSPRGEADAFVRWCGARQRKAAARFVGYHPPAVHNPYLDLTDEFNRGELRVLLSSGQAVVVHRLAIMSKDGDWILREQQSTIDHVLAVLEAHGARYRFGAPLALPWLAGGWSSHFEFAQGPLRIRTDFVSRPPRISPVDLAGMWASAERSGSAVVELVPLARIKLTNRDKDYAVVGELARLMRDPADQLRFARSARELIELSMAHPDLLAATTAERPALAAVPLGRDALETALDRERRALMRVHEERLQRYQQAAAGWAAVWTDVAREVEGWPLRRAHAHLVQRATSLLPTAVETAS